MTQPHKEKATAEQIESMLDEYRAMQPLSEMDPLKMGEWDITDFAITCDHCQREMPGETIRARITPHLAGVTVAEWMGICKDCKVLQSDFRRIYADGKNVIFVGCERGLGWFYQQFTHPDNVTWSALLMQVARKLWRHVRPILLPFR